MAQAAFPFQTELLVHQMGVTWVAVGRALALVSSSWRVSPVPLPVSVA
jgi:hypothetical protein